MWLIASVFAAAFAAVLVFRFYLKYRARQALLWMTSMSAYSLGDDPHSNHAGIDAGDDVLEPSLPYAQLVNAIEPLDVDGQERAKYGYASPFQLPRRAVLLHPAKRSGNTCVLFVHGYGRCFDHFNCAPIFREHASMDLCGLDLRHHGRAYTSACLDGQHRRGGTSDTCHNMAATPGSLHEYYEDLDDARAALLALGYERVVLWGSSAGGLTDASYLVAHADDRCDDANRSSLRIEAAVFDAPLLAFHPKKIPGREGGVLQWALALVGRVLPHLIIGGDPPCGPARHAPTEPTYLDKIASSRKPPFRYDRFINSCRGASWLCRTLACRGVRWLSWRAVVEKRRRGQMGAPCARTWLCPYGGIRP